MSINRVILSGVIGQYGVKIEWTVAGKPQTAFTLVCEEEGKVSLHSAPSDAAQRFFGGAPTQGD